MTIQSQKQFCSAQSAIKKVSKLKMVSSCESLDIEKVKVLCKDLVNSTQNGYTTGVDVPSC